MARPLRGALRGLCLEFGWSYAVAWKIGEKRLMHLVFEDGYYVLKAGMQESEKLSSSAHEHEIVQSSQSAQMHVLISKLMASQVHVVGDGLVGEAAASGSHRWILRDNPNGFSSSSKGIAEIGYQFLADIQTIVIIPVLPFRVIQLGSTQMVLENPTFVNHVRSLFMQLNYGPEPLPSDNVLSKRGQIYSLPSALNSGFSYANSRTTIGDSVNICNHDLVISACKSPYSAVVSQFNRMPLIGSGVISSQETIEMGNMIPGVHTSSLKVEARQASIPESHCGDKKNSLRISDLSANIFKTLEDELLFNPGVSKFETTNTLLSSLDDGKSASLFSGSEACKNGNEFVSVSCLPSQSNGTIESCDNIHISRTLNSFSTQPILGLSQENQHSIIRVPSSESTKLVLNNKVAQASHDCSSESEVLGSCSKLIPDTKKKHASSNSLSDPADQTFHKGVFIENSACTAKIGQSVHGTNDSELLHVSHQVVSSSSLDNTSGSDPFNLLGLNSMSSCLNGSLDDVFVHNNTAKTHHSQDAPKTTSKLDVCPTFGPLKDEIPCCGVFSVTDDDQLLDAVISRINSGAKQGLDDDVSCKTSSSNICSSQYSASAKEQVISANHKQHEGYGLPSCFMKSHPECSNYGPSTSVNPEECSQNMGTHESQIHLWIENDQTIKYDTLSALNDKNVTEGGKLARKRPRPGENPRPRPKDRQMIQDRVKELREIVPNGAKCSIDALLEKTIKHMLFLQSVTKHADKLKDTGESKISNEEGGLLLKDNFEGGATWAFEVGTQSMICPIIVEDLHPPRQLLVEMLCEERGFFLEIADFIKGLGLTILKGVMEARKTKVWARFAVEANRDVTRMEIFLSLVKLLEPSSANNITLSGTMNMPYTMCHQTTIPATGSRDHMQ